MNAPTSPCSLDRFCRAYWWRLHGAACQRGCSPAEAEDVVQEVFLSLTRRGMLVTLEGRSAEAQMAYLSMRLRCILLNRWRDANRQCRGAMMDYLSLGDEGVPEPMTEVTPETEADRAWLATCLTTAIERLREQGHRWSEIIPVLVQEKKTAQTGAQRVAMHRARQRLRHFLREEMNGSFHDWVAEARTESVRSDDSAGIKPSHKRPPRVTQ
jgi:hypothetical protein